MGVNTNVQMLKKVPLFSKVDLAHLQVLVFSSSRKTIPAGTFVYKKSQSSASAYLILSGRGVVRTDENTSSSPIARVEAGALVGEMAMIGKVPYSTSVQVVSDMEVLELSNKVFMRVCEEFPDVGKRVLAVLADKLDTSLSGFRDIQGYFENARSFTRL